MPPITWKNDKCECDTVLDIVMVMSVIGRNLHVPSHPSELALGAQATTLGFISNKFKVLVVRSSSPCAKNATVSVQSPRGLRSYCTHAYLDVKDTKTRVAVCCRVKCQQRPN
jgi:hypothetical protein